MSTSTVKCLSANQEQHDILRYANDFFLPVLQNNVICRLQQQAQHELYVPPTDL